MGYTDRGFNFHSQFFALKSVEIYPLKPSNNELIYIHLFPQSNPPFKFWSTRGKVCAHLTFEEWFKVCGFDNPLNHRLLFIYLSVIFVYRVCSSTSLCFWLVSGKPQCAETLKRSWVFIDRCITPPLANILGLSLWEKGGGARGGGGKEESWKEGQGARKEGEGIKESREVGGGRECLWCVCVRVRTFMQTIKIGFYFIKTGNVFSPKDMISWKNRAHIGRKYLQIHTWIKT